MEMLEKLSCKYFTLVIKHTNQTKNKQQQKMADVH